MDRIKNPEKYYLDVNGDTRTKRNTIERNILDYLSSSESYFSLFSDKGASDFSGKNVQCNAAMIKDQQASSTRKGNYLKMNNTSLYEFYCSHVHCNVGPLNTDDTAMIRFRFRLWSKNLAIVNFVF